MKPIEDSELILNGDGTVFHLHLLPENIADNIILVGDQDRTDVVAQNFDTIDFKVQNREFKTITGTKNGKRISVHPDGYPSGALCFHGSSPRHSPRTVRPPERKA